MALELNTTGNDNTAVGCNALAHSNDSEQIAVGSGALQNYTISVGGQGTGQNVAVGFNALNANVSGDGHAAVGWSALASDVTTVQVVILPSVGAP